jgi:transcriptional regulator with XRE-family HTH domain
VAWYAQWHTVRVVAVLRDKFLNWLRKMPTTQGHGEQAEVAEMTGLDPSFVSRLFRGKRRGDIGLSTLEKIADHYECSAWAVLWMVETGTYELPPSSGRRRK